MLLRMMMMMVMRSLLVIVDPMQMQLDPSDNNEGKDYGQPDSDYDKNY